MSDFKTAFRNINKAVNLSVNQALKKAGASTKVQIARMVNDETGLPVAKAKKRVKVFKPTSDGIIVSIATSIDIAAHVFNTGKFKVKTRVGDRYGAYYKINGSRQDLPKGAFLTNINTLDTTKKLVLTRTGDSRYPVKTVTTPIFVKTINRNLNELKEFMHDSFSKNFKAQLKYNTTKA